MNCDSAVHLVADIFAFIHKDPPTLAAPSEIAPVLEQTIADKRIDRDMTETNEINRKQPETRVLYEADGICSTYITTDTQCTSWPIFSRSSTKIRPHWPRRAKLRPF